MIVFLCKGKRNWTAFKIYRGISLENVVRKIHVKIRVDKVRREIEGLTDDESED